MKRILVLFNVLASCTLMAQEGSVGIGTQSPNEKAVLHLVAPNNDQGFLVPKLTTSQRTDFANQLTPGENGMMVFDLDLNQFFFWLTDHWEAVGASLQAGSGLEIVDGVISNTGDPDASDDFSGNWADLANVPAAFGDDTDDVDDADADPENELQDLNLSGDILTISGLAVPTQIDLSSYVSINTDEQDLLFSSGQISLSGDPDNTIIDLSAYDTDASDDFSGDWTDLQNIPTEFEDGTDDVDDADNDPTNEIELPSTATTGDALKYDGTNWVAATDETNDADNDPTNEIELPASASLGDVLKFNDALEWAPGIDQIDDADNDPTNELQDLNLTSNILTITGIGSPTQINLAAYIGTNTDEQDLQFSGGQITLSGDPDNTIIDLSNYDSDASDDFSGSFLNLDDVPLNLDLDLTDDFSGSFLDLTDVPLNLDLDLTDDFSGLFSDLSGVPLNLDLDVTDDFSGSFLDLSDVPINLDLDVTDDFSGSFEDLLDIPFYLDTDATDDFSGSFLDLEDVPVNLDTDFTNDFSGSFLDLSDVPGNLDVDATDDFSGSFLDLSDVPGTLDTDATDDFSGEWGALLSMPTDFSDGTDDVDDADADPGNEFQDISFDETTKELSITNDPDGSPVDLSGLIDIDITDLLFTLFPSAGDVLKYNGLLWVAGDDEVNDADASTSNELQDLQFGSHILRLTNDPVPNTVDLSVYLDNTDELAGITGDDGQVAKLSRGTWIAADDAVDDADASPNNEIQDLDLTGNTLTITSNPTPTSIDLSGYLDNTDLLASITGSDGIVVKYFPGDGGWQAGTDFVDDADADPSNEFQTITRTGTTVTLSDGGGTFSVNDGDASSTNEIELPATASNGQVLKYSTSLGWIAGTDLQGSASTPWSEGSDAIGSYVEYSGHAKALNMVGTSVTLDETAIGGSVLKRDVYKSARIVRLNVTDNYTLSGIDAGIDGQEIIFVNVGSGQFTFDNSRGDGSNLFLPSAIVTLQRGGTLTLMYVDDKDAGFGGWVPLAGVGSIQVPK